MGKTSIEWCSAVWNPLRGCTRVSPGCVNCYAEVMAARFSDPGLWGHGVAEIVRKPDGSIADHRWTGKIIEVADKLLEPLHWRKPQRVFVNSTSDLFHEGVSDTYLDQIFAVMVLKHQHTFLPLTKRARRMQRYMAARETPLRVIEAMHAIARTQPSGGHRGPKPGDILHFDAHAYAENLKAGVQTWPPKNIWMGVSAEDQARFDERWPDLAMTPAATRFISYEPALGPVDFTRAIIGRPKVDQIIVGGESGPGARPFNVEWAAQTVIQCRSGGVAAFVKQMGAAPFMPGHVFDLKDKKGGDMAEWPLELRVREMPA